MSFLRTRLSRVFGGSDDLRDKDAANVSTQRATPRESMHQSHLQSPHPPAKSSPAHHSLLELVKDQVFSQHRSSEQAPQITRRNRARSINAAASTKIKDLSESIRATTHLFYTLPNASTSSRITVPSKASLSSRHSQRSEARSSLRSRRSGQSKSDDPPEVANKFLPLTSAERRVVPHEIDVSIPTSGLLEESPIANLKITVNSPPTSPTGEKQHTVYLPLDTSQKEELKDTMLANQRERSSTSGTESLGLSPSTASTFLLSQSIPERRSSRNNRSDSANTTSGESHTSFDSRTSTFLALPSEIDSILTLADSKRSSRHGSLFVKGSHDEQVFSISPYRKAMRELKMGPSEDAQTTATWSDVKQPPLLTSSFTVFRKKSLTERSSNSPESILFADAPEYISHIEGRSQGHRPLSAGYQADVESSSGESEKPRLGSIIDWYKWDTDRRGFGAAQAMDAETESDTETDVGLQLRHYQTSPADSSWGMERPEITSAGQNTPREKDKGSSLSSERKFSPFPRYLTTQSSIGGNSLLEQNFSEEILSPESIKHAVEAINKINGYGLDLPISLRLAIEAIERPTGASMGSPLIPAAAPWGNETEPHEQTVFDEIPALALGGHDTLAESALRAAAVKKSSLRVSFSKDLPRRNHDHSTGRREDFSNFDDTAESSSEFNLDPSDSELEVEALGTDCLKEDEVSLYTDTAKSIDAESLDQHTRCPSSQSATTTDSCAVTTHHPKCYSPISIPSIHLRNSPVRRTPSINDKIHESLGHLNREPHEPYLLPRTFR